MDWRFIFKTVGIAAVIILIAVFLGLLLMGCEAETTTLIAAPSSDNIELAFIGELYDNAGNAWFTIRGHQFNISPNKVKEYSYDSNGSWISQWVMSSVMSIDVDGQSIDTCGSSMLIYDNRLTKYDCEVPPQYDTDTFNGGDAFISAPNDYSVYDYFTLNWWWIVKDIRNYDVGRKMVVIMSQDGSPICMFSGDYVTWQISRNLPKTTEIQIDGKMLYVHRCNFSIIDMSIFDGGNEE